ncbi:MAG: hypothetical protein RMK94_15535 [Armatimonadota bacterium]|nr:hypothetical protein [Armatimonadota bacterium]
MHLIVGAMPIIRFHGDLHTVPSDKLNSEQVRILCTSLLESKQVDEKQVDEFERNGYLCFGLIHPELEYFHVTLYRHRGSMEAAN